MKNGALIVLEASWALNTRNGREAEVELCGTRAGAELVNPKQALVVTQVLDAVYESAEKNKTIWFK